eukprot:CFRG7059T1
MKFTILSITLCFLISLFGVYGRSTTAPATVGMAGLPASGYHVGNDLFTFDEIYMAAADSLQRANDIRAAGTQASGTDVAFTLSDAADLSLINSASALVAADMNAKGILGATYITAGL